MDACAGPPNTARARTDYHKDSHTRLVCSQPQGGKAPQGRKTVRIRLIAGEFGGRYLDSPDTGRTHPMGERIRSALFNILGDIEGTLVLDAFAGTGSLGLEALSRGAAKVTFVEK